MEMSGNQNQIQVTLTSSPPTITNTPAYQRKIDFFPLNPPSLIPETAGIVHVNTTQNAITATVSGVDPGKFKTL